MLTRKVAAVAAGVALGAIAFAGNAFAHVEVTGKPAQALAKDAVVSFSAEAESTKAGIASVRVVLPQGIAPADVTLVSGPSGWTLTPTADGYSVAGKALGVHKDAVYSIKIAQLPDAKTLPFKTLVNYSNGDVDRWIEVPSSSNPSPDNPAPVLKLAAAASPTTAPVTDTSPSAAPSQVTESAAPSVSASVDSADAPKTSPAEWALVIVLAAIAATLAVILARRKMNR